MNGITFKGIHSSNFNLIMLTKNRPIFSEADRFVKKVSGLAGTVDFGNDTYTEMHIKLSFSFDYGNDLTALRIIARDLRGWLYNDGEYYDLIFDDEPDRKYKAKVNAAIDLAQGKSIATFEVDFICNPPHQFLLDNSPVTPADEQARLIWDTATINGNEYLQNFNANGVMRFTVGGSASVKPIIKVIGYIESGFKLVYGAYAWQYDGNIRYDGIVIDCNAQTVIQYSDTSNLFTNVNSTYDDYFELQAGQASIAVTGVSGAFPKDIDIIIYFEPVEV